MATTRTRMVLVIAIALMSLGPAALSRPAGTSAQESGKTVNLQLIVDSSGSMAAPTDTGALRMDSAKAVLSQVISQIPDVDGVNVGFRVYGHLGNNTDAGRPESCASTELLVPMDGVDSAGLAQQVTSLQPVGWTPLGLSLQEAAKDFTESASDDVVNAIVMVTDGLETCDADPIAIAGELRESDAGITTHVIGFGTTPEEQAILSGIAEQGGGELFSSANAGQLMSALFSILEDLEVVEETGTGETRDSPLGVGRIGRVGDFELSVLSVTPNDPSAFSASAFGEPAPPGEQFFIARISVTYVGATTGNPAFELNYQTVGETSVSYTSGGNLCGTGDLSTSVVTATELFEGGTGEYDVCWQIASEDEDSLVMYVEPTLDFDAAPVWLSLGNPIENTVDPNATEAADEEPTESPAPRPTRESNDEDDEGATVSSRAEPVAVGEVSRVGDFDVSVLGITPNSPDAFSASAFGEPAPPGEQFFIARIGVTYVGSSTGNPAFELNFQAVGETSVSYSASANLCGTADLSTSIVTATELFEGGSGEYDVCWQIDSTDETSLVMYVEPSFDFDAEPVWFSLQP